MYYFLIDKLHPKQLSRYDNFFRVRSCERLDYHYYLIMASTRRNPQARAIALSAAVVVGTAYFAITKYPCIKHSVLRMLGQPVDSEAGPDDAIDLPREDNSPILIDPDSVISLEPESVEFIDASSASTDALKSWLSSVCIHDV